MSNKYVYCADCKHFQLCNETPHCSFEDLCNIEDCEDSKPFSERPCYVARIKSEISDEDLGKIMKYVFANNGGAFTMEWDSDYEEFFENYITSIEDAVTWYKNKKYVW